MTYDDFAKAIRESIDVVMKNPAIATSCRLPTEEETEVMIGQLWYEIQIEEALSAHRGRNGEILRDESGATQREQDRARGDR